MTSSSTWEVTHGRRDVLLNRRGTPDLHGTVRRLYGDTAMKFILLVYLCVDWGTLDTTCVEIRTKPRLVEARYEARDSGQDEEARWRLRYPVTDDWYRRTSGRGARRVQPFREVEPKHRSLTPPEDVDP